MRKNMTLEKQIEEFAAAVGIAEPIAAESVWKFSADGHVFGVAEDDSGSALRIYGEIPAPSPDREDAFRKLEDEITATPAKPSYMLRATDTFYVPSPRPDAADGWASKNTKAKDLLEAIYYNLERGAKALGAIRASQELLDKVSQE